MLILSLVLGRGIGEQISKQIDEICVLILKLNFFPYFLLFGEAKGLVDFLSITIFEGWLYGSIFDIVIFIFGAALARIIFFYFVTFETDMFGALNLTHEYIAT